MDRYGRGKSIKLETMGSVEFTTEGERLTLRYTRQFRQRAVVILLRILAFGFVSRFVSRALKNGAK
jgi:hypothetical protein